MDKGQAFRSAVAAAKKLVAARGVDAKFPFDAIWAYAEVDVPSTMRPGVARRLLNDGYLELTGGFTRAATGPRAGSPTREYRPGPHFRPSGATPSPATGVPELLQKMADALDARGLIVTVPELTNFYLAVKSSPMVLLVGVSGTGKSLLPRHFAELVGASFRRVGVQPHWADDTDLFGYTPSLAQSTFVPGEFTNILAEAKRAPEKLVLLLLDETNLAPVEHYLSEFLSVTETQRRNGGQIVSDAFGLDLPYAPASGKDPYADYRALQLAPNLRVVGTANMDETTRPFSPKVLDRSFSIEFRDVDLEAFPGQGAPQASVDLSPLAARILDPANPMSEQEVLTNYPALCHNVGGLLEELRAILSRGRISFAYRTRKAILLYLWHWRHDALSSILTLDRAFDYCVLQKVLPKISGSGEDLVAALEDLEKWLSAPGTSARGEDSPQGPFEASAQKVGEMRRRLESEGATTFWAF